MRHLVNPDNSQRGLVKTSLETKEKSFHGYVVLGLYSKDDLNPAQTQRKSLSTIPDRKLCGTRDSEAVFA